MKVGIDFDNTIVSYDKVFYSVALEQELIPSNIKKSKLSVREYLREKNQGDAWTELQGYVYGKRMLEADTFPGFIDFLKFTSENNIDVSIVSHKTIHPYLGKKYNLHDSAREFISKKLLKNHKRLISDDNIFFELTQQDKALRIGKEECDYFVDDLPEIFLLEDFPEKTIKYLFDPDMNHKDFKVDYKFSGWKKIALQLKNDLSRG